MMTIIWVFSRCKESVKRLSWAGGGMGEGELPTARELPLSWNALLRAVRASNGTLLSFTCTILICCYCYKAYPKPEFETTASQNNWNYFLIE